MLNDGPTDQPVNHPPKEEPKISQFTDSFGTTYSMAKDSFLGGGIEGRVFEGVVVSRGANADPSLTIGSKVAVKQQPLQVSGQTLEAKTEIMQREIDLLVKEGSCYGSKKETVDDTPYMFVAIPKLKGVTLREAMYEIKDGAVDSKKDLTADQKKNICYGLLKDYAAQQMLSIMHVDIKPDNMLIDSTGKIKVIDFGNGYDRDLFTEHPEGFQSPGDLYAAQENYDPSKGRNQLKCSVKADGYAIGILLASVWTKSCYEKDAVTGTGADNGALLARKSLDDILAPNAQKPADMPDDLFTIIRHLAAIDPDARPENIAQADGVANSVELKDIYDAHQRLLNAKAEIKDNIGNNMQALSGGQGKVEAVNYTHLKNLETNMKTLRTINDATKFNQQLQSYAAQKDMPESARQVFKALATESSTPQEKFKKLVRETHGLRNPLAKFTQLFQTMDNLRDIASQYEKIVGDSKMPAKRKERLMKETTAEYNKVLTSLVDSHDPDYMRIVGKTATMDTDPVAKMRIIEENNKNGIPKMIEKSLKEGSLFSQTENRINQIVNSTNDIPTMRNELMKIYADLIRLATHKTPYNEQCKQLTNKLDGMITTLDTLRANEARTLQGNPQMTQPIPHALPAMAPVIIQRKRTFWKQLKDAYKEFKDGNNQVQPPVHTPVQTQAQTTVQTQAPTQAVQTPTQTTTVQPKTKPLPPVQQSPQPQLQANPLFLQQRLNSILSDRNQNLTASTATQKEADVLDIPKSFNPLDFRPKVPPRLARQPQSEFVSKMMGPVIDRLDKLITLHENVKVSNTLSVEERIRAQREKEALFVEIKAFSNILVYLKNNPTLQEGNTAELEKKVSGELKAANDGKQKVAEASGVGDIKNSNYQLSQASSILLNDMLQDLKPKDANIENETRRQLR
jgi:serine/threonine protein kinase